MKTFSGRAPSQVEAEIHGLISLFREEGVRSYLEIGARHGDTFHMVMTSLPLGSVGVAVDLPGAAWGKSSSVSSLMDCHLDLQRLGYSTEVVIGDSAEVVDDVSALGPFDAALIDGDHRYEGVKQDWENYSGMARLVAFHDIAGHGVRERANGYAVEVPRFWGEVRVGRSCKEFVANGSKMGIGVVYV